jgi:hypothetical protein
LSFFVSFVWFKPLFLSWKMLHVLICFQYLQSQRTPWSTTIMMVLLWPIQTQVIFLNWVFLTFPCWCTLHFFFHRNREQWCDCTAWILW